MNLMVVVQEMMRCADEMVIDQINERNEKCLWCSKCSWYLPDRPWWDKSFWL